MREVEKTCEDTDGDQGLRTPIFRFSKQRYSVFTFHCSGHAVSEELGLGSEFPYNAHMVGRCDVEESRDWGVMRYWVGR